MSGFWSQAPAEQGQGWTESIGKHQDGMDQVEVGLLGADQANDPEEIKMGGLLAVVGKENELSMFCIPRWYCPITDHSRTYAVLVPIKASSAPWRCDIFGLVLTTNRIASYHDHFVKSGGAQRASKPCR